MKAHSLYNISLKQLNTFGIDVIAREYFSFASVEEVKQFLPRWDIHSDKVFVLGGGSNVLFLKDYSGIIIHPENKGINIVEESKDDVLVKVAAGEVWDDFVAWAVNNNLYGIENLSLIPGNVGAAPVQNIGAYGMEVYQTIDMVRAISLETGEKKTYSNSECDFGYRSSIFKNSLKGKLIILEVFFRLQKRGEIITSYGNIRDELSKYGEASLRTIRQAVISIRRSKLPDPVKIGNAGSFFKNPVIAEKDALALLSKFPDMPIYPVSGKSVKLAAGWLIDQAGWKGKRIGDAGVHEKQALVLVNYGNATGEHIMALSEEIMHSVKEKFGVNLEREVNVL